MNAVAHRNGAAAVVGLVAAAAECRRISTSAEERTLPEEVPAFDAVKVGSAASLAWLCGTLPDLIEPAAHPNHRQFFHSVVVAGAIAYGLYRAWKWQPEGQWTQALKLVLLAGGGAYLVHLALDATTPRSLPLVGTLR